jgi:adenylate cyclase
VEINPKYPFAEHVARLPFRNRGDVDGLAELLRKAGISVYIQYDVMSS